MTKTRVRWLAFGAACALLVTGCSSASPTESSSESSPTESSSASASAPQDSEPCADPETFCVGLVLEGGVVDDGAFNAAAWEGVREAAEATDSPVIMQASRGARHVLLGEQHVEREQQVEVGRGHRKAT